MLFYSVLFHLIPPYPVLFCSVKHTGHDLLHWFHHRSVGLEPQLDEHWPGEIGQTCWDGCWEHLSVPMCVSEDSLPPGPSSGWPIPTENFHSAVCQQPQTLSLREEGMPSTRHPCPCISAVLPRHFWTCEDPWPHKGSPARGYITASWPGHGKSPKSLEYVISERWEVAVTGGLSQWEVPPGLDSAHKHSSHIFCVPHTVIPLWLSW